MLSIPFLSDNLLKWFKPQTYDDQVDRLNYFVTPSLLVFFSLMISAKQYVGSPIQCWVPMEFKGGWEQYTEDYCFIKNTYFLPLHKRIPTNVNDRREEEIGYYQWVPIVLAIQALMFFIPNWIWKTLHQQSGIDLNTMLTDAEKLRSICADERQVELTKLAKYVEECLEYDTLPVEKQRNLFCFRFGHVRSLGSFVSTLYLFSKMLYLVNILGQFILLNQFLGSEYTFWGIQVFNDLMHGREWQESGVFPRITLCDFAVRRLANIHRYTVQCVLMVNMFNEKIYLFIWFWFLFVAISTIINFLYLLIMHVPGVFREKSALQMLNTKLNIADDLESVKKNRQLRRFIRIGLRPDGVLLLRFVHGHAGAIIAKDLSERLFADFTSMEGKSLTPALITSNGKTKSVSPTDDGFSETLPYDHQKQPPESMSLLATAPINEDFPPPMVSMASSKSKMV